jgi:hypothetical protein
LRFLREALPILASWDEFFMAHSATTINENEIR